jgi:hypothetical protein
MSMWRETTQHERNRIIWEEELESFVPDQILDFHVHIWNAGVAPEGKPFSCGGHPITKYDFDDLRGDLELTFPRRNTKAVCFGFPDPTYNLVANNDYIAEHAGENDCFALRLLDPLNDTPDTVNADLASRQFLGLKPYPDYVRKPDLNEVTVEEMLPPWAMEIADAHRAIIMLHIPRRERLADALNQAHVAAYCERYPNTAIVLAHIGRAYFLKNVLGKLDHLREFPNLYVDLAMVNHWEVMEYTFAQFPLDRILFGSDIPIALAPGKSVEINDQYTYVTPVPWKLSISDEHRKLRFTSFLYEELRAIKKAATRLELDEDAVRSIFYGNGIRLLTRTGRGASHRAAHWEKP